MQDKIITNDGEVRDTVLLHLDDVFFFCIGRGFRITTDSLNPGTLEEIMKNVTIVDMHERIQLCLDLTNTDIYDFV